MKYNFFLLFIILVLQLSCSKKVYYGKNVKDWKSHPQPDTAQLKFTIYLIGDVGDPDLNEEEPTLKMLRKQIELDSNSALIFLGDNIYEEGLPPIGHPEREKAEKKINEQLKIAENYKGKVFFISGNHDWDKMGADGLASVIRQEQYIEEKLNKGNTFIPDMGCPGPYRIILINDIVLIALDSQWWLHDHAKPYGNGSECDAEDESDVIAQLQDYIDANKNKNIMMVAHHPLFSNGNHGGYFSLLDYIFPLRLVSKNLYIPLPLIGSLYPLHRKFGGTNQDIVSYPYQRYKNAVLSLTQNHKHLIYAAGHDHNLQYHGGDSLYHIVSGAGSKLSPVRKGNGASFVKHSKGFSKVKYFTNNEVWVEYFTPEKNGDSANLSFSTKVYTKKTNLPDLSCGLSNVSYKDSTVVLAATKKYKRTRLGRFILGEHYRKEWTTPIKVNLMDLKDTKGGLMPYGKGGGKQSLSLKLKDPEDHEYNLRSVRKNPAKAIPVDYRNTFLEDLVSDQVSAQHPYGALVVPPLADAAKVYHTNPKLVLIPNDSCLGPYREEFKNTLALFEEDPDENQEDVASLANAKNIVGTEKTIAEVEGDNDNKVDAVAFARARLFDMFLGDWDRHERQYRWAEDKSEKGKTYIPIAEDRDQVFFNFDGVLPFIVSRKWMIRNLQNFDDEYDDVIGLNLSGRIIDRRFLSPVKEKDWKEQAESIKAGLTDEVIEKAIATWPPEIYALHGPEIIRKLKSRRDLLPQAAAEYFKALSKYVDVYGSNKNEKFIVRRVNDQEINVLVYKITKSGKTEDTLFYRTLNRATTKEVRLYGLGGNDVFEVDGQVKKSILVRIIGGSQEDSISDHSSVKGISQKTVVYESKKGNVLDLSSETNEELTTDPSVHDVTLDKFNYNSFAPQVGLFYNVDDGLFMGGGFLYKKYKFRSQPYAAQHRLLFSIATNTGSKKIEYDNDIKNVLPGIDLHTTLRAYVPAFVMNYFGYGNESPTPLTSPDDPYHRVLLNQFLLNPSLNKNITRFFTVGIGPKYEFYQIEKQSGSFIENAVANTKPSIYNFNEYLGLRSFIKIGAVDNAGNPSRGIILNAEMNFNKKLGVKESYAQYLSEFIFYITPNLPFQLTFASRTGAAANTGRYEFYQANMLGSGNMLGTAQNLRGYRKTRFIGDRSFYQNTEVRLQLLKFNVYLFPGKFGILALADNGRVWANEEHSNKWHFSYGAGPWLNIFNKLILTGTYTISEEDKLFNFRLGFAF